MSWALIAILLGVFAVLKLFDTRCASCGRFLALRATGRESREVKWFTQRYRELKCAHCGELKWRNKGSNE